MRFPTAARTSAWSRIGHSMGGLLVRQYAQTYRHDVAGVVLAEATSETIYDAHSAEVRAVYVAEIDKRLIDARPGVPVVPLPDGTPADVAMCLTPKRRR
jgi:pimeloyl-ACP methyl ester carboxylesterase